jgi:transposase
MIGSFSMAAGDRDTDRAPLGDRKAPTHAGDDHARDRQASSDEVDWDKMLAQLAAQPVEDGWVTLQEASSAAGVSRSTLRSWYRSGQIPSRMVAGDHGPQRMVLLEAVVDRALRSSRARRQLENARSLEAEVDALRHRVEVMERHLGLA